MTRRGLARKIPPSIRVHQTRPRLTSPARATHPPTLRGVTTHRLPTGGFVAHGSSSGARGRGRFPASRVRETVGRKWFPDLNLAAPASFRQKLLPRFFHVHGSPRSVRRKLPPTQTGKHGFHPPVPCFASSHVYFIYYYYRNTLSWRGKARCRLPSASLHVCFPPVPTAVALPRDRSSSFLGRADHAARAAERCAADGAKG
jgi:hypothetical protein